MSSRLLRIEPFGFRVDHQYRAHSALSTGNFPRRHIDHDRRCGWNRLSDGVALPDDLAPIVYRRRSREADYK